MYMTLLSSRSHYYNKDISHRVETGASGKHIIMEVGPHLGIIIVWRQHQNRARWGPSCHSSSSNATCDTAVGLPHVHSTAKYNKTHVNVSCVSYTRSCQAQAVTDRRSYQALKEDSLWYRGFLCYWPPLWSSGQSSWLLNGDVLCFAVRYELNLYMLCRRK
jgi:hypothetical protein